MQRRISNKLNLIKICSAYRVSLWSCPEFLFVIMGIIIIIAIISTYVVANQYEEPEVAALIVLALSALLFFIGYLIVKAFERVALAAKSKSEFISIMSHQLRSPLSAIKWQMDMLFTDYAAVSEPVRGYLETVNDQNERMIRSVNDLLEVNRIEDNDLVLRPAFWPLKALSQKIIDEYTKIAGAHNLKMKLVAEEPLPNVFADEERIKRVMEHLVNNSITYSFNGGTITVSITAAKDGVLWKITDEGAGLSKEDQKKIFGKFFRSSETSRYQTEGTGVGLFIARSIIEESGGDIGFSSELGKGSSFWFSLPVKSIS